MAGIKNYLPQNIKSLRMAYGESQMDLAFAIGLDSPSAISNYEKGIRNPKPEVRKKLAEHFRVTEEQLMHVDLSGIRNTSFNFLSDIHKAQELTFAAFPVVCSETAMKNASFAAGYNAHMRIKECMLSGQEPDDKDYDICFDSYDSVFEKDAVPEAAGNMLWWLLQLEYIALNQQISQGAQHMMENKISGAEFLQQYYLKNFDFESEDDGDEVSEDTESLEFYKDIEEIVQDLLKKVKSSQLSDLAYYYTAVRYAYGLVRNEYSQETNQAMGREMLWAMSELGNKYAKKFLQIAISVTS